MAWTSKADPHEVFSDWYEEGKVEIDTTPYKHAFTLCTTGLQGEPNGRTVYMRDHTQKDSSGKCVIAWLAPDHGIKANELDHKNEATGVFLWASKKWLRQVRVKGIVSKADRSTTEKYFKELPRHFQIGVWCSEQDKHIPSVKVLDDVYEITSKLYPGDTPVPCPPFYYAYLLHPHSYEFYDGGEIMIHNLRARYTWEEADGKWSSTLLAP